MMSSLDSILVCVVCGSSDKVVVSSSKKKCTSCEQNDVSIDSLSGAIDELTISDDKLFQEPPPREDCDICFLPMPHSDEGIGPGINRVYMPCCGKTLCTGCITAAYEEWNKGNMKRWCLFCRIPMHRSSKECFKRVKVRMKLNDAEAYRELGDSYKRGTCHLSRDFERAFELFKKGSELGSCRAQYYLGNAYLCGQGIEEDEKEAIHHFTLAAMGGHEIARHNIGAAEKEKGNMNVAMKHWMIAAKSG